MHARARPSNKQHDGEERQRCGRKTMSSALFLADVWMKMRPARGAVRVTLDSPQTPASQKKFTEGRISQIASSHIPSLNSVRLRFDSNLNRIGTPQGGREAEHLSDCSFHLTSTVRFSKRAGSHQKGSGTLRQKWPRTCEINVPSAVRAEQTCNLHRATHRRARIRRYVVQASCFGLYYGTTNMRARARPSNPQHDGEERQRCGRKTMSSALFLADVWMKMRPARGPLRVTLDPPQTPKLAL